MVGLKFTLAILLILGSVHCQDEEDYSTDENVEELTTVAAPIGPISGVEVKSEEDGQSYYAFRGIPYAEPPVGPLRFKDPVPVRPWRQPINATDFGSPCVQLNRRGDRNDEGTLPTMGSEDCLFLNVFTPRLPSPGRSGQLPAASMLPVIVWVHGGGFAFGNGNEEGASLLEKDVIFVSLNYRLSALGFLTLGNSLISGNQALKDQLEALRWVKHNIHAFGGDPSRVTIAGQSAGGISAHLHQISPQGGGLFHGVIAQSGSGLMLNLPVHLGRNERAAEKFLAKLGCDLTEATRAVECLQGKSVDELLKFQEILLSYKANKDRIEDDDEQIRFQPTVDSYAERPYMPDLPYSRLLNGQYNRVPSIVGVVENDGGFQTAFQWNDLDLINSNWTQFATDTIYEEPQEDINEDQRLVADVMRQFYTGGNNITQENIFPLVNFYSDYFFDQPAVKSADLQCEDSGTAPVFFYRLTEKPTASNHQFYTRGTTAASEDWGVVHNDDLLYLFGPRNGLDGTQTEETKNTAESMRNLWTNFAKYLDPTPYHDSELPAWTPYTCKDKEYLELKNVPELKSNLHRERNFLWDKSYFEMLERLLKQKTLPAFYQPQATRSSPEAPPRQVPRFGVQVQQQPPQSRSEVQQTPASTHFYQRNPYFQRPSGRFPHVQYTYPGSQYSYNYQSRG